MQSAPAAIPATIVAIFPAGFAPHGPPTRIRLATSRSSPAAAASRSTGTNPAVDTKFDSSNEASTRDAACNNRTGDALLTRTDDGFENLIVPSQRASSRSARRPQTKIMSGFRLRNGTVRVLRTISELPTGELVAGPPKSRAGVRHVTIPRSIVVKLSGHLGEFGSVGLDDLIFTGEQGQPLRRSNFNKIVKWKAAVAAVGLPVGFRFHDLRHTGNTLAPETGASTRELMERMGHDSSHAALIYQHGSARRDRAIADALDALIDKEQAGENGDREEPTGT